MKSSIVSDSLINRVSANAAASETVSWCILRNTARSITNGNLVDFNVTFSLRGNFVSIGDARAPVTRQFMHNDVGSTVASDGRVGAKFPNSVIQMAAQNGLASEPHSEVVDEAK